MKKTLFLLVMMLMSIGLMAQVEKTFDFNNYGEGQILNGQDGWYVRVHSAGNGSMGPMYTDYLGHFWGTTPETPTADETLGVFSHASGTSFGDIATHDITQYGFDFSNGGVIEIECDQLREWWGTLFGIGYDGNGDGSVLPPIKAAPNHALYEPIVPDPNSTSPDGGIYMLLTGSDTDPLFIKGVVLPDNNPACNFPVPVPEKEWVRWKISIMVCMKTCQTASGKLCQNVKASLLV